MSNLHVMRSFNAVSEEFLSENLSLSTISDLISTIRTHRAELTSDQYKNLLEIPLDVLKHDVVLEDQDKFQKSGDYFCGNIGRLALEHEFLQSFVDRIKSNTLDLKDMVAYIEFIQDNPSVHRNDYLLRNPEVTIRDFVLLDNLSSFKRSGRVYARLIDRIIVI